MTLDAIWEQPRAVESLRSALERKTEHHAYLLTGPEGVGKATCVRAFAQALLCPERPRTGCGTCETCARIAKGLHPDVTWVMPEEERVKAGLAARADFGRAPSRDVKVDQIRALGERLALRPLEASHKVACVLFAERMNDSAQNALLKTLEEPPEGTVIFLVATSAEALLPTVRSRCAKLSFGPLSRGAIARKLQETKGMEPDLAEKVAALSGGSLGRALAMKTDALEGREALLARFEALPTNDARQSLAFAEVFGGSRDQAETTLGHLSIWLADLMRLQAGGSELVNFDLMELARSAAERHSPDALVYRHRLVEEASWAIGKRNGSPRLQMERMLLRMAERT